MRNVVSFILVFCGFLLFGSCEKVAFEPPVVEGEVSFANDVAATINNDCGKCHAAMKTQTNYYKSLAEKGFIDTVQAASSKIYLQMKNNAAHQGYTTPDIWLKC
ncbi:MAG: hypothetical protein HC830_10025 [Bacteroidetes bacterium]|nr:hypothetical protein [Bacteroidota bacterium]